MATVTNWNPFGVALNVTATGGTVTRKSATQFTVAISAYWETYWSSNKTNYGMEVSSGGVTKGIPSYDGEKRSSGSGTLTGTYSISGNGSTTKSIDVTFRNYNTDAKKSATKTVTFNVTVPAWTSYTVTYNDNGGSGAPAKQTKWRDQALTLSTTKPTRTGYSFLGWSTSSSATTATYSAGATLPASVNANTTLYAVWKANEYPVTYNANGGSDAPAAQKKKYGVTLKLSSTKPTRKNYNFLGWATTASATKAQYAAGANYTANEALSLYAVWELAYVKPRITNLAIMRQDGTGNYSDTGSVVSIDFKYECDKPMTSVVVEWKSGTGVTSSNTLASGNGEITSGTINQERLGELSAESTYTIKVTVTDTVGSSTISRTLPGAKFVIDILAGGDGIAFNKPAELAGVMDIGFQTKLSGGLLYPILEPCNVNELKTPNVYAGRNLADHAYTCGTDDLKTLLSATGTFIFEVLSAGPNGQILQRITICDKKNPKVFERWFYTSAWSEWTGGWIYPALGSEFRMYGTSENDNKVRYRKDGRLVEIRGVVSPTVDITGDTLSHEIFKIPDEESGYRPASPIYIVCQGSGTCTWLLQVSTSGSVTFSRYRNGDTWATAKAKTDTAEGAWLPFQVTYLV